MAATFARHLSREERQLIDEAIARGDFRDLEEFETLAVRRAIAQLRLRKVQALASQKRHSPDHILREARKSRRAVARRHGA